ncbi:hypothetical protein TRFO_40684 [Tritrichomonas foetus]|uniref:Protein kinase domain-containing protein n=1 Tax=Tritrichomonas foetus TaxID=1144522 RepID=A0A1J4J5T6_9EUKA|nr:hypothetical protein TRFO_40684 [Tritrichomonas foetus]|eukprot:OHS93011.1 hypothetical protein TRFO_40684 [Tritrichomonas foetus]
MYTFINLTNPKINYSKSSLPVFSFIFQMSDEVVEECEVDIFSTLPPKAKHLIQYAEVGNPEFMVEIGDNFRNGINGFPQDDSFAVKYYKLAADYMNEDGLFKYANMLAEGLGCDRDLYLAKRIYSAIPKTSKYFNDARTAKLSLSQKMFISVKQVDQNTGELETGEKVIVTKSAIPLIVMDVDLCHFFELATPPLFLRYFGESKNGYDRNCVWGPISRYYTLKDAMFDEINGKENPLFNPTTKSKIIYGIANSMKILHDFGIWHCDLNPSNIYLNEDYEPVLFNMCYSMQSLKSNKFMEISYDVPVGQNMSRVFWSPELLITVGTGFEPSYDVYSFAMIVYALFNKFVFNASNGSYIGPPNAKKVTLLDLLEMINDGKRFERPKSMNDPAWSLVTMCWANDKERRPTFQDIVHYLDNTPVHFMGTDKNELKKYMEKLKTMNANE